MEKSKDRENRLRGKGTRKHKAETQKLTPMDESTSLVELGARTWAAIGVVFSIMKSVCSNQPVQSKNV